MAGEKVIWKDEYGCCPHDFPHRRAGEDPENYAQSQAGYECGRGVEDPENYAQSQAGYECGRGVEVTLNRKTVVKDN